MDFDAFIREVEAKSDAIWMEELQDVRRLRLGVVRSGAGTNGQLFNALLFAQSEVRGLTINVTLASGERVGVGRHLVLLANTGVPLCFARIYRRMRCCLAGTSSLRCCS